MSTLTQQFGPSNKLLSSQTSKLDTASDETSYEQRNYSYDPAGRRTGVSGAETAAYGYDWRNQPTRTTDDVSSTRVTYDGLGRPVSRETETAYSTEAVTTSFFGGAQLGSVSTLHGASSNVWGVFGQLAGIDSEATGEARWALLDRLGSVVAEAGGIAGVTGADIRELASYIRVPFQIRFFRYKNPEIVVPRCSKNCLSLPDLSSQLPVCCCLLETGRALAMKLGVLKTSTHITQL